MTARRFFLDAADSFATSTHRWWEAKALLHAGQVEGAGYGAPELRRARAMFNEMGAPGWRELCEREMRRRGIRWATARSSDGPLSAREREIVGLVAAGLTNRQIAERLVLSENTVGRHLTRIFAKLGVRSRAEAAQAVDLG